MTEKKRQHYVPRFYLRSFAITGQGKNARTISLFNIPRRILVPRASIAEQCAKDWFYGPSGDLEESLSVLEEAWSPLVRTICEHGVVPAARDEHILLLLFVSIQLLRTQRHSEDVSELIRLTSEVLGGHSKAKSSPGNLNFGFAKENPVHINLQNFLDVAHNMEDLGVILLRTSPVAPFVTSDNPVFRYNLYCESFTGIGTIGAASVGLLVFLPLSPSVSVLLYDRAVYKVTSKGRNDAINIFPSDVVVLNGLQYIGADCNLYFSDGFSSEYFSNLSAAWNSARRKIGVRVVESLEEGNPRHGLIHSFDNVPNLNLHLSFLSVKRRARRVPIHERGHKVRGTEKEVVDPKPSSVIRRFIPVRKMSGKQRLTSDTSE